jgi:hypothetical protein
MVRFAEGDVPEHLQGADAVHRPGRAGDANDEFSHAKPPKSSGQAPAFKLKFYPKLPFAPV